MPEFSGSIPSIPRHNTETPVSTTKAEPAKAFPAPPIKTDPSEFTPTPRPNDAESTDASQENEQAAPALQPDISRECSATPNHVGKPTTTLDISDNSSLNSGTESTGASGASNVSQILKPSTIVECVPEKADRSLASLSEQQKSPTAGISLDVEIVMSQHGVAHAVMRDAGNRYVIPVNGKKFDGFLRQAALSKGEHLRKQQLSDLVDLISANAEFRGKQKDIWSRVAPFNDGIEIDIGDDQHTRIQVLPGRVEIIRAGSETLFARSSVMLPLPMPAESGDLRLLSNYLNLHPMEQVLLIAWMSYTLAHPKIDSSKFVILVIAGDQGSGKTTLCKTIILRLVDNHRLGVQVLTGGEKELSIASQHVHVLAYDNVRNFNQRTSDALCVMSTGGNINSRALYTNDGMHVHKVHGPLILNGIHSFITQSDLAQRCLPLRTQTIKEKDRKYESDMAKELERDLPVIFRGLLDLISKVLQHLDSTEVMHPERMLDFSRWLAAMEKVDGTPAGVYQSAYSHVLRQAQLDSLFENPLASAMYTFATDTVLKSESREWTGSPAELLNTLSLVSPSGTTYSRSWPDNPIALSKRLVGLQASLLSQGIELDFGRGKHRTITIKVTDASN